MKWFKFESEEREYTDQYPEGMLIYLSPEALKHAIVVNDFEVFQSSSECVPGGRLLEVSRQFSYRLRQVADLVEEPLDRHEETEDDTKHIPRESVSTVGLEKQISSLKPEALEVRSKPQTGSRNINKTQAAHSEDLENILAK